MWKTLLRDPVGEEEEEEEEDRFMPLSEGMEEISLEELERAKKLLAEMMGGEMMGGDEVCTAVLLKTS